MWLERGVIRKVTGPNNTKKRPGIRERDPKIISNFVMFNDAAFVGVPHGFTVERSQQSLDWTCATKRCCRVGTRMNAGVNATTSRRLPARKNRSFVRKKEVGTVNSQDPSIVRLNKTLNLLITDGSVTRAEGLFANCRRYDVVTLNTMMKLYASIPCLEKVVHIFEKFAANDMQPTVVTYSILVRAYADNGFLDKAQEILKTMPVAPNAVTYLAIMKVLARKGDYAELENLLSDMKKRAVKRSPETYNALLHGYCNANQPPKVQDLLDRMAEDRAYPTAVTFGTFMAAFSRSRNVSSVCDAYMLLRKMKVRPDAHIYAILIGALVEAGRMEAAGRVMAEMLAEGVKPNQVLLLTALKFYALRGDAIRVLKCLAKMRRHGSGLQEEQVCAAVSALTSCGCVEAAHALLQKASDLADVPVTIASWNALLKAYRSQPREAEKVVVEFCRRGITPNERTLCMLVDTYIRAGELDKAESISYRLRGRSEGLSIFGYSTLMKLHREVGRHDLVQQTFEEMRRTGVEGNPVVYSTLISSYGRSRDIASAFQAFEEMKREDIEVNAVVYGALIHALCSNGDFDRAITLLQVMRRDGTEPNTFVYTTLVVNLARHGRPVAARKVAREALEQSIEVAPRAMLFVEECFSKARESEAPA